MNQEQAEIKTLEQKELEFFYDISESRNRMSTYLDHYLTELLTLET